MPKEIFVNLPVKDLSASIEFFTKLGFTFNTRFTDENATCMIIGENMYAMLLTEPYFKRFTAKEIVDATQSTEVLIALSLPSKEAVDEFVQKALDAGGRETKEPQNLEFMYGRDFEDLDGHIWEMFWMNPEHLEK